MSFARARLFVLVALLAGAPLVSATARSEPVPQRTVPSEKTSRTPAQRKIGSALLYEIYRLRGEATEKNVPPGKTVVKIDERQRVLVDVRVDVTPERQKDLVSLGASIVSTSQEYHSIVMWMPLLKLEQVAQDPAVRAILPAAEPATQSDKR